MVLVHVHAFIGAVYEKYINLLVHSSSNIGITENDVFVLLEMRKTFLM